MGFSETWKEGEIERKREEGPKGERRKVKERVRNERERKKKRKRNFPKKF